MKTFWITLSRTMFLEPVIPEKSALDWKGFFTPEER
jgi:hypothetical protein